MPEPSHVINSHDLDLRIQHLRLLSDLAGGLTESVSIIAALARTDTSADPPAFRARLLTLGSNLRSLSAKLLLDSPH